MINKKAVASWKLENIRRRVKRARNFPHNTTPASRHLEMIADVMATGEQPFPDYPPDELRHIAQSMYSVLESFYKMQGKLEIRK